jgi:hypothetical protein
MSNGAQAHIDRWLPVSDTALQWVATLMNRPIAAPPLATSIASQAAREAVWPAAGVLLILGLGTLAVIGLRR